MLIVAIIMVITIVAFMIVMIVILTFSVHRSMTKSYSMDNIPLISYEDFKEKFKLINWEIMQGYYPSIKGSDGNQIHASLYEINGVYYTFSFIDYFRALILVTKTAKNLPHNPTKIVKVKL